MHDNQRMNRGFAQPARPIRVSLTLTICLIATTAGVVEADTPVFQFMSSSNKGLRTGAPLITDFGFSTRFDRYKDFWRNQVESDGLVALQLRDTEAVDELAQVLDWMDEEDIKLDYVFIGWDDNSHESYDGVLNLVRGNPNPLVSQASIGKYSQHAGPLALSGPHRSQSNRSVNHKDYLKSPSLYPDSTGLNVSQPQAYPYEYYEAHTTVNRWGDFISPNRRSALFWAPLERVSVAKRNLPEGHQLIPYVSDFIPWDGYNAPPPTEEDRRALLQHLRLRGADGYMAFYGDNPEGVGREKMESDFASAWSELDPFFELPGTPEVLELGTNKTSGLEYSAVRKGNRILALATNLSGAAASIDFTSYRGLPDKSPVIPAGEHRLLQYMSTQPMDDDFQQYVSQSAMDYMGFQGPSPQDWRITSARGSGHDSDKVLSPKGGSYIERTWWETENPGFEQDDVVVYSAKVYGNQGVAFAPIVVNDYVRENRANGLPSHREQGPMTLIHWGKLLVRSRIENGAVYRAANFAPEDSQWYDIQLVADPSAGAGGEGSWFVRNLTAGETDWTQLFFDDLTTKGTVEFLESVPLRFTDTQNPTTFNGWYAYGYNYLSQLDDLSATLYPFLNNETAQLASLASVPEPATAWLAALAGVCWISRRRTKTIRRTFCGSY